MPKGGNGERATVRQVLNHTSGLYDYAHEVGCSTNRWRGANRFRTYRPQELPAEAPADAVMGLFGSVCC